jgi:hypothetical protein
MLLEILIFFGIISFLLVLLTDLGRHTPLGIIAGVIMLFMAYSLLTEGLQTITGQITYTNSTYLNDTSTYNFLINETKSIVTTSNQIITQYVQIDYLLGLSFLLIALYLIIHYSMQLTRRQNE